MRTPLTAALLLALALLPATTPAATLDYFPLPDGQAGGGGIAAAPDGRVWAGAGRAFGPPELARLDPARAAPGSAAGIDLFPTPTYPGISCCANGVRSVTADARSGRVWFGQNDGVLGYADPLAVQPGRSAGMTATWLRTELRSGGFWSPDIWDIAIAADGTVWFTERSTSNVDPYPGARIARTNAALGITELSNIALQGGARSLDSLRYDAMPQGIAVDATGRPWFAESSPGNPGWRIATPRGGGPDYDEYLVTPCAPVAPCSGSHTGTGITDVTVAPDGSIWFTNQLRNELGRLDVSAATFTSYSLAAIDGNLALGRPTAITTAADGTLWLAQYGGFSRPQANALVKIVPDPRAPTATVFAAGAASFPLAVTTDGAGNVWFLAASASGPSRIGRLAGAAGGGGETPPPGGGGGGETPPGGGGGGGTPPGPAGPGGPAPTPTPSGPVARALVPVSVGVARAGTPSTDGDRMSIDQICLGPPEARCSVVYIISAGEYVTGFPGARSDQRERAVSARAAAARAGGRAKRRGSGRARRARAVILGQKTVTLRGGQRARVSVTLNARGRGLLRRAGRLRLFLTVTERQANGSAKRVKAAPVSFRAASARRRRPGS